MIRRACASVIPGTVGAIAAAVLLLPAGAEGQMRAPMPGTPQRVCDASLRLLTVRVVDGGGAPVSGATIEVRSIRTGTVVARAAHAPGFHGAYLVLDDSFAQSLAGQGADYRITATKGKASGSVRWRVAMDASGCHLIRTEGADTIRLG